MQIQALPPGHREVPWEGEQEPRAGKEDEGHREGECVARTRQRLAASLGCQRMALAPPPMTGRSQLPWWFRSFQQRGWEVTSRFFFPFLPWTAMRLPRFCNHLGPIWEYLLTLVVHIWVSRSVRGLQFELDFFSHVWFAPGSLQRRWTARGLGRETDVSFFKKFPLHYRNVILQTCFNTLPSADNELSQSEHTHKPHPGQETTLASTIHFSKLGKIPYLSEVLYENWELIKQKSHKIIFPVCSTQY